eukprot:403338816
MDDLKNLVIQSLEEEGTLSTLRAQLRARVFHAIENHADTQSKQQAGFQWQNPTAQRIHENEDSKLIALMIKEYLEFYRMEYTLSTYIPEVALQNNESSGLSRDELIHKSGLQGLKQNQSDRNNQPLLVQMLKMLKEPSQVSQDKQVDDVIEVMGGNKAQQQNQNKVQSQVSAYNNPKQQQHNQADDIEELLESDQNPYNPNEDQFNNIKDDIMTSGSVAGIDQSIDTYRMDEYDYMEDLN